MPVDTQVQIIDLDFRGGIDMESNLYNLAPSAWRDLSTCFVMPNGGLVGQPGIKTNIFKSTGVNLTRTWWWPNANGAGWFIHIADGRSTNAIFTSPHSGPTTLADVSGTNVDWNVDYGDERQGCDGEAAEYFFYITSPLPVTSPVRIDQSGAGVVMTPTTFTGTANQFPRAAHLEYHHDRMYAARLQNYPNRIAWSDLGDVETWQALNYVDVNTREGDWITGLVQYADSLVIFKTESIFVLSGVDSDAPSLVEINLGLGTLSAESVTVARNKIFFLDQFARLQAFNGASAVEVSGNIRTELKDELARDSSKVGQAQAACIEYDGRILLSTAGSPTATANLHTWAYDLDLGVWTDLRLPVAQNWYIKEGYLWGSYGVGGVQYPHPTLTTVSTYAMTLLTGIMSFPEGSKLEKVEVTCRQPSLTPLFNFDITAAYDGDDMVDQDWATESTRLVFPTHGSSNFAYITKSTTHGFPRRFRDLQLNVSIGTNVSRYTEVVRIRLYVRMGEQYHIGQTL